ncbi:MAG: FKBP-type peptidyl-prolyl cis-trans isomerase [Bacteroidales bacterium]|nr:FKBP-type peptidyl-prolyl cis-trans isomerase [Bacteroidales bacterium]
MKSFSSSASRRVLSSVLFIFSFVVGGLVAVSCSGLESDYAKQQKIDDEIIGKYLTDNNIQAQRHSVGFYFFPLYGITLHSSASAIQSNVSPILGALKQNDIVSFYYTISLLNGTVIESNEGVGSGAAPKAEPAKFRLLSQTIIPEGLDYGIKLMSVGQRYRFFMPSYLAYGNYSTSYLPVNSNLIIEIEVVGVQTQTQIDDIERDSIFSFASARYQSFKQYPSGLCFVDSIPGAGEKPFSGDRVKVDFTRSYLNDTIIKSVEDVMFFIGNGQAVEGLEESLRLMKSGGTAVLIMPSSIAFKQSLCIIPQKARADLLRDKVITSEVLPYSIVKYVVKLKSVN